MLLRKSVYFMEYRKPKYPVTAKMQHPNSENVDIFADDMPSIEMHQIQTHLSWFKKALGINLKVQLAKSDVENKVENVE